MLFVLLFFIIIEVSCNFYYMNNMLSPERKSPHILNDLFYDHYHAEPKSFSNVIFFPTTQTIGDPSYDLQAKKLLNYFDSNLKNPVRSGNKMSQTSAKLPSKQATTTKFETVTTTKSSDTSTTPSTTTTTSSTLIISTTNLTTIQNPTALAEISSPSLETTNFLSSTTSELDSTSTISKKLFVDSIIKDLKERYKIDLSKNYNDQNFDCLKCEKIADKNDCYAYAPYDTYNLINTFCCQCNNNKKKKLESDSSELVNDVLVIIAVIILVSILFCCLLVYLSVWVYRLFKISKDDVIENENGSKIETNSNDKNESIQENSENNDIESEKASINTMDSLDASQQDSSKRYTNLKNLNKNNSNSISQECINKNSKMTASTSPIDNFYSQDIVCDEFNNKSGSKLNYTIDYKVNNEFNVFDHKTSSIVRKNYHSACTNLSSNKSDNIKDTSQTKKLNNRINKNFVFK